MKETSKPNIEKEQTQKNETIYKELNDIIDKINKNFDFKTFEKQKLSSLEEVIIKIYNYILLINIEFF
jgi:uncharacterized FlaG/YvyC family protein